jgi:hypothetical protein
MKEKILAAIRAKFPAINLSKKRLEQIAAFIETKVIDDETKIDAALTLYNEYNSLTEMASHDDKLRTAEKKLKETTQTPKEKSETTTTETVDVPDDPNVPVWAKALLEGNKKLTETVTKLQAERAQTTIQSQLKEKLKDVNPLVNWADWKQPETDEEMTAFVEKVTTKNTEVVKTLTDQGLQALTLPKAGVKTETGKTAVSASLKQTLEQQNKSATQVQTPAVGKSFLINTPGTL